MAKSTTSLSTNYFRKAGYKVANVEKDCRGAGGKWTFFKKDLFGAWDLLCVKGDVPGVTGVQTTTKININARIKKILASEAIRDWIYAGNKAVIHGWGKEGRFWVVKIKELTIGDLSK